MTLITLTPEQLDSLSHAEGSVQFADSHGRIVLEVDTASLDPHRLRATTIPELIEELSDDDWDEEELKEIVDNYKPVGTLSNFLQRVTNKSVTDIR